MRNKEVIRIVLGAMFISFVFVATYIGVPWPFASGGYMHLGTLVMLVIAIAFGKEYGALAGGVGMGLFDILSPYAMWAPGTFVVRLLMGYMVGYVAYDNKSEQQGTNIVRNIFAILAGMIIMIPGYYLYEALWLTDFNVALASIPGNIIQFTLGSLSLAVVPIIIRLKKQMDM
jgi:uncharacterized membrane protein